MSKSIFLIGADNALTELTRTAYSSEDLLQRLLADHPALLGSALGANGGLLLVQREQSVPDAMSGVPRWSLDHLFIDRDGVPILVEVKRASDTRARREVVAQMLDYAANGVAYWPVESIVDAFRMTATAAGADPDERLSGFLGDGEVEAFWKGVDANLRSGRIRMVFLADSIARELRRIVEFLNEQMRPAEVLAVEVVQYVNANGVRTLVPTLVGATERAQATKSVVPQRPPIDEMEWLDTLEAQQGHDARSGAEKATTWLREHGLDVAITASQDSLCATIPMAGGKRLYAFFIRRSTGKFEIPLQYLTSASAYAAEDARLRLLQEIKSSLPMIAISTTKATGWPAVPLTALLRDDVWGAFSPLVREVIETVAGASR